MAVSSALIAMALACLPPPAQSDAGLDASEPVAMPLPIEGADTGGARASASGVGDSARDADAVDELARDGARDLVITAEWTAITPEMLTYYSGWYATVRVANRARSRRTERWGLSRDRFAESVTLRGLASDDLGALVVSVGLIGTLGGAHVHAVFKLEIDAVAAAANHGEALVIRVEPPELTGPARLRIEATDIFGMPCVNLPLDVAVQTHAGARFRTSAILDDDGSAVLLNLPMPATCSILAVDGAQLRFADGSWAREVTFALQGNAICSLYWTEWPRVTVRLSSRIEGVVLVTEEAQPYRTWSTYIASRDTEFDIAVRADTGSCSVLALGARTYGSAGYYVGRTSFTGRPLAPVNVDLRRVPCVPVLVLVETEDFSVSRAQAWLTLNVGDGAPTYLPRSEADAGVLMLPLLQHLPADVTVSIRAAGKAVAVSLHDAVRTGYVVLGGVGYADVAGSDRSAACGVDLPPYQRLVERFRTLCDALTGAGDYERALADTQAAIDDLDAADISLALGRALANIDRSYRKEQTTPR